MKTSFSRLVLESGQAHCPACGLHFAVEPEAEDGSGVEPQCELGCIWRIALPEEGEDVSGVEPQCEDGSGPERAKREDSSHDVYIPQNFAARRRHQEPPSTEPSPRPPTSVAKRAIDPFYKRGPGDPSLAQLIGIAVCLVFLGFVMVTCEEGCDHMADLPPIPVRLQSGFLGIKLINTSDQSLKGIKVIVNKRFTHEGTSLPPHGETVILWSEFTTTSGERFNILTYKPNFIFVISPGYYGIGF